VDARNELCTLTIARILLQQQFARFLVQRRLGIGVYEEAFNSDEDMADPILGFPVLLQSVDADLAVGADVWMKDLRGEPTFWRGSRKLVRKAELDSEVSSSVRCTFRSLNDARNIQ